MKKFLKIGIAWIYFLSIAGLPLHSHYCGDTLTQLKLFTGVLHSDDCECNEIGDLSCCSDVVIHAQVKDQTLNPKTFSAPKINVSKTLFSQIAFCSGNKIHENPIGICYSLFSPPLKLALERVQLQVFRI